MTLEANADNKSLTGRKTQSHGSGAVTRAGSPFAHTFISKGFLCQGTVFLSTGS